MIFKNLIKKLPFIKNIVKNINNQNERDDFIKKILSEMPKNSSLLDAGCGNQRYKKFCNHLKYFSQDFYNLWIFDQIIYE